MSISDLEQGCADRRVLSGVETAARLRRQQTASRQLWSMAPSVAAACLVLAAAARWFGWPGALPVAGLVGATLLLLARGHVGRRDNTVPDDVTAAIDAEAALGGELRSATWFARRDARDAWAEYHVSRAADRLRGTDWLRLYPAPRARGAKLATTALVIATLALSASWPHLANKWSGAATVTAAAPKSTPERAAMELALPELQKQLEALLAAAERGDALPAGPAGTAMTAAQLQRLIADLTALAKAGRLKDLAHAMTPQSGQRSGDPAAEMKALAKRARDAAEKPAAPADVRQALEKVSEKMADAAKAAQADKEAPQQADRSAGPQKGNSAQGKKAGDVDELSIQSVREADAGSGAGMIMMANQDDAASKAAPGLGLGGGSDKRTNGGAMANLEAILRRETIDASTDTPGQSVQTDTHRKTEHGTATVTYAQSAAAAVDRGSAVAPPAVPEGRRAAVQSYFIRKP